MSTTVSTSEASVRLYTSTQVLTRAATEMLPGFDERENELLSETTVWAHNYLTNPHPALGRSGHVCPWVDASMRRSYFFLTLVRCSPEDLSPVENSFHALRERFLSMQPSSGRDAQLKTIVVVIDGLTSMNAGDTINRLHERLKPAFVDAGLMLGEFFPACEKPGLHNASFRPLRSPIPLIVIRCMVSNDISFLAESAMFMRAFIRKFGATGADQVAAFIEEKRDKLTPRELKVLSDCIAESGVRVPSVPREIDSATGLTTIPSLLTDFDARISNKILPTRSPAWLAFKIDDIEALRTRLGEESAGALLAEVGRVVASVLRVGSHLAASGDWFAIVIWEIVPDTVPTLAERVRAAVASRRFGKQGDTELTISVGVFASANTSSLSASDWYQGATSRAVSAAVDGGNRVNSGGAGVAPKQTVRETTEADV